MNINPMEFVAGTIVATILLILGLGIGWTLGRRSARSSIQPELPERRQVLDFVRSFASFTTEFAGDFSKYQEKLNALSADAAAKGNKATAQEVQQIIKELLEANRTLQSRLNSAEIRLEEQTRELTAYLTEARTDALTGLPNRRALDAYMDQSFDQWREKRLVFSLALLDIDFFKSINDSFGHPVGDAVLKQVAGHLVRLMNTEFKIGRYGGEEFAVVMPCNLRHAAANIEKLRGAIAQTPALIEGDQLRITISCGVAEIRGDERLGTLFRRTDEALYSAKIAGRNRVFIHNGTICEPFGSPGEPERAGNHSMKQAAEQAAAHANGEMTDNTRRKLQVRFDEIIAKEMQRPS